MTGDNGLLQKATNAKEASKEAEIREKIQLAVAAAKTNNSGELKKEALEEQLIKEFGENNYELVIVGKGYIIIVDNIEYRIEEDGIVQEGNQISVSNIQNAGDLSKGGQYNGDTEETAYRITCIEDLVEWSNNYNNYKDKNIKLDNTIDFNSTSSYKNAKAKTTDINENAEIEELITELTTGIGFKPIESFNGIFDAQNNAIKNIYENINDYNGGLIGKTENATIKNLTITGKIISNDAKVGGVVGLNTGTTIINNCVNDIEIMTLKNYTGGIVGWNHYAKLIIINSCNKSNITGNVSGGIIGITYGTGNLIITNCYNVGNVTGNSKSAGILAVSNYGSRSKSSIYNSVNIGTISNGGRGIVCSWSNNGNIDNCYYLKGKSIEENTADEINYEEIKSQEFVDELNTYVNTYNEEHKNDEGFISLTRWKYNEGDYPTFE